VRTLRGRLFLYLGAAVLLSTVLTIAVAALLVRGHARDQAQTNLDRQAGAAVALGGRGGQVRRTAADGTVVAFVRGGRLRPLRAERAEDLLGDIPGGDASGRVEVGGRDLLYAARSGPEGRVVLVRSAKLAAADWRPFVVSLLLAGLGGAAVALVLSALLARRLLRPLGRVAGATRAIAAGDGDARVDVEGDDELASVGRSFNAMADQLAASREAERAFLLSVSHELKTPLTAIRGYAEAIGDGAVAPQEAGAVIGAEADRLERLVRDLLDLARLDQHAFAVAHERVDLGAVAERARERAAGQAAALGVALEVRVAPGATAVGDDGRTLQAVSNLVDNALRATPAGGRVVVDAKPGRITVRDTGPGLDPEDLPRAFDRFHLHAKYGADRQVGSGLGLAVVRELARAMGGDATVASRRGEGAAFTVRLATRNT
jgi:signal transduction histidine kinase